ncbi:hypothetical protein RQP50_05610 [Paenibacillus sp. chi10]|uniref:Uncharacterized protein n=1 Tax=Paenibacillus suaedae TaxID=3077233 RepID=A0AAJ2JS48_9BACL|nr:hypothetical protein [Paenibacillus sp. chi10]MDT8975716.1 hypothetical protein [Paenibacillus sp. chi10]
MLKFENKELEIYDFWLPKEIEAQIIKCFVGLHDQLLFPYYACNFESFPEDIDYIKARTKFISQDPVFEDITLLNPNDYIYWYEPTGFEDLVGILNRDYFTYRCIVVPKDGSLKDCRFKLFTYEHAMYMEEETRALYIEESKENDYENNVYPLIRKIPMDITNEMNFKTEGEDS